MTSVMRSTGMSRTRPRRSAIGIALAPFYVGFAVQEIGRLLAVLELGPFLHQQLDELGVFREEAKVARGWPPQSSPEGRQCLGWRRRSARASCA